MASTTPTSPARRSGPWIVIAIIVIGVSGAVIGVWYQARRPALANAAPTSGGGGAGVAPADPIKAHDELEVLRQRYDAARDSHEIEPVIADLQRFTDRYPRDAEGRQILGLALSDAGRYPEAYQQLERSLELDKQQPETHLIAGTVALSMGKLDEAGKHYGMAADLSPQNANYRVHLAQVYLRQHDFDRARTALLTALRIDPKMHEAYASLTDLYMQQNNVGLALTQIDKAIANTPASQRRTQVLYIRQKASLLRRDNKPDEALLVLGSLGPQEKVEPGVVEDMAVCWMMQGQPAKALAAYEKALAAQPTDEALLAGAVRWARKAGDQAAEKKHADDLRRINPRSPMLE